MQAVFHSSRWELPTTLNWIRDWFIINSGVLTGASLTSCEKFQRMLGCPFKASLVSVNMPKELIAWSPCLNTLRCLTLVCSWLWSSFLVKHRSTVRNFSSFLFSSFLYGLNNIVTVILVMLVVLCSWGKAGGRHPPRYGHSVRASEERGEDFPSDPLQPLPQD